MKVTCLLLAAVVATVAVLAGCGGDAPETVPAETTTADVAEETPSTEVGVIELTSAAFEPGAAIPVVHTCDGKDESPPLSWGEPPRGTTSFALIMDDPDALEVAGRVWVHWLIYNVPARARSLAEGIPRQVGLPAGARQGDGDSGTGYHGPCPPPGRTHTYSFRLYALDAFVPLDAGLTKEGLLEAMQGHILATGELQGTYSRR
jgi:Raf kinase inhibitor-like YbhB/YbcL family protein